MEFDVAYGVRTMEQLQELIAFYRAMPAGSTPSTIGTGSITPRHGDRL